MNRTVLLAAVCCLLALATVCAGPRDTLLAPTAQAQNIGQRTVLGTVLDASSAPVAGATVFLQNGKTKAIRSFTSIATGHFHFAQVDMSTDFDLWTEKDGKKSAVKTVSSWDARKDFISDLKLK
ncbi:MAG: carboxypeptidase-like regulatory domain-containing protein [Terracidiphilus sp.]